MTYKDWRVRIEDILEAIEKIDRYIDGMSEEDLAKDELTTDAVICNLEIIGEAAHAIPKTVALKYDRLPWAVMSEMRNILIHEYHSVPPDIIHRTAVSDLPPLVPMLKAMLEEEDEAERKQKLSAPGP